MLFYKLKKKKKNFYQTHQRERPLMNKTLNKPQDLIKNAHTGHGTTKVEDLEWIARLKQPWHSRVECEGGGVKIGNS